MPIAQLDRASVSGTDDSGSTPDRHNSVEICLYMIVSLIYESVCFFFNKKSIINKSILWELVLWQTVFFVKL